MVVTKDVYTVGGVASLLQVKDEVLSPAMERKSKKKGKMLAENKLISKDKETGNMAQTPQIDKKHKEEKTPKNEIKQELGNALKSGKTPKIKKTPKTEKAEPRTLETEKTPKNKIKQEMGSVLKSGKTPKIKKTPKTEKAVQRTLETEKTPTTENQQKLGKTPKMKKTPKNEKTPTTENTPKVEVMPKSERAGKTPKKTPVKNSVLVQTETDLLKGNVGEMGEPSVTSSTKKKKRKSCNVEGSDKISLTTSIKKQKIDQIQEKLDSSYEKSNGEKANSSKLSTILSNTKKDGQPLSIRQKRRQRKRLLWLHQHGGEAAIEEFLKSCKTKAQDQNVVIKKLTKADKKKSQNKKQGSGGPATGEESLLLNQKVNLGDSGGKIGKKNKTSKSVGGAGDGNFGVQVSELKGYCPPPGIVHESLVKGKNKMRQSGEENASDEEVETKSVKKIKTRERNADRTVFVGNLPVSMTQKDIKKKFRKYGEIDSVRIRSAVSADPSLPKKVAVIKNTYHSQLQRLNAYIVFKEVESARTSLKKNGKLVDGHHLRVDLIDAAHSNKRPHDYARSVFVGNLAFDIDDDSMWEHFEQCGPVESVRIVRDSKTGVGKGFGYVLFKTSDAVSLALKLDGRTVNSRKLRVTRAVKKEKKSKQKEGPNQNGRKHFKGGSNPAKRSNFRGASYIGPKTKNAIGAQRRLQGKDIPDKKSDK